MSTAGAYLLDLEEDQAFLPDTFLEPSFLTPTINFFLTAGGSLCTGNFRGSSHQECNLKLRIKPEDIKIPVIFHNLHGYNSHFIMQQIGEIAKKHAYTNKKGEKQDLNINAIPNNMEKYMAFMLGNHLTFINSFQFVSVWIN